MFYFYIWGFAPVLRSFGKPTSFATEGSFCGIATYEVRLRREAKRLHLDFNLINYFTCKTMLVLFSTNFILAFFATFCGGKKLNKKIDKLKNFQYILLFT